MTGRAQGVQHASASEPFEVERNVYEADGFEDPHDFVSPLNRRFYLVLWDFHSGNYIFVGSKRGIPWVGLFEPDLDFLAERVGSGPFEFGFRNRNPRAGEAATYSANEPPDKAHDSYATLALLPNLAHSGVVLLLNGASMESTEAAGEFAMRDEFPEVMQKVLGARFKNGLPFFEILLRIHVTAGAPDGAEIVAWRTLQK